MALPTPGATDLNAPSRLRRSEQPALLRRPALSPWHCGCFLPARPPSREVAIMRTILARTVTALLLAGAVAIVASPRPAAAATDPVVAATKARAKKARKKVRALLRKNGLAKLPS